MKTLLLMKNFDEPRWTLFEDDGSAIGHEIHEFKGELHALWFIRAEYPDRKTRLWDPEANRWEYVT